MRVQRIRLTIIRLLLAVAIVAILLHLAIDPLRRRERDRYERCLELAASHASQGAEYRRNAQGDPIMLRIADWHEQMRREFERAAREPGLPIPHSQPFPPAGWVATTDAVARE